MIKNVPISYIKDLLKEIEIFLELLDELEGKKVTECFFYFATIIYRDANGADKTSELTLNFLVPCGAASNYVVIRFTKL